MFALTLGGNTLNVCVCKSHFKFLESPHKYKYIKSQTSLCNKWHIASQTSHLNVQRESLVETVGTIRTCVYVFSLEQRKKTHQNTKEQKRRREEEDLDLKRVIPFH